MNEDYGVKHIFELPLNNEITAADSLVYDQAATGESFRLQIQGLITFRPEPGILVY